MSRYTDSYTKQAMWEAHDRRCFYCREPLSFKNIHVDHVIPQVAFKKGKEALRTKYRLSNLFDFNSLDNFSPSCPSCNAARKRNKELENGIPIWLDELNQKKEIILKNAVKLKHELSMDLPDQYKEFFLTSPDFMQSDLSLEKIRKADIDLYKGLAFAEDRFPLELTSPDDETLTVHITNLNQYEKYRNKGYYAYSTGAIGISSLYEGCLSFFKIFENAKHLQKQIRLKQYYKLLPIDVLPTLGEMCEDGEEFGWDKSLITVGDLLKSGSNIIRKVSSTKIRITVNHSYEGFKERELYIIEEVLQADFTGDGNPEALLLIYFKSAGSFHLTCLCQVSFFNNKWHIVQDL